MVTSFGSSQKSALNIGYTVQSHVLDISKAFFESIENHEIEKIRRLAPHDLFTTTADDMGAKKKDNTGEVTDFTDIVGGNGPWQKIIFAMIFLAGFPCAWHTLVMSFLAPNIDHWCAKPPEFSNLTDEEWKQYGIPSEAHGFSEEESHCKMFEAVTTSAFNSSSAESRVESLVSCNSWQYDESLYESTVLSEWNLVCDKAWTVSMTNSVFMTGSLTSVVILGQISDKIGRKPALMATVIILIAAGIASAFSTSYVVFAVARFFDALGTGGLFVTGFIILMEAVGRESRSVYGLAMEFGWCTGYVMLPLMAWVIKDWFWIQVAITLPCLGLLSMWWLVPESPRWLLSQRKFEKAEMVLAKAAKKNKRNVPDMESALKKLSAKSDKERMQDKQGGTIIDLFRTRGLWQKTLNLVFNWVVISFVYYGLSFNTNDLAGDPFINFAIAGAVEFPAYLISLFVIQSLGRRIPLTATMVAGGVACLITIGLTGELEWIRVPLAMFGKFCITAAFGIVYVYTAEIFPTVVRNTGVGTCSMCGRGASILAPFVKELGQATHPAVPLACFGALSVASGALILLLPETNRCDVPDTLQEAADFGRKKRTPSTSDRNSCVLLHDSSDSKVSDRNDRPNAAVTNLQVAKNGNCELGGNSQPVQESTFLPTFVCST